MSSVLFGLVSAVLMQMCCSLTFSLSSPCRDATILQQQRLYATDLHAVLHTICIRTNLPNSSHSLHSPSIHSSLFLVLCSTPILSVDEVKRCEAATEAKSIGVTVVSWKSEAENCLLYHSYTKIKNKTCSDLRLRLCTPPPPPSSSIHPDVYLMTQVLACYVSHNSTVLATAVTEFHPFVKKLHRAKLKKHRESQQTNRTPSALTCSVNRAANNVAGGQSDPCKQTPSPSDPDPGPRGLLNARTLCFPEGSRVEGLQRDRVSRRNDRNLHNNSREAVQPYMGSVRSFVLQRLDDKDMEEERKCSLPPGQKTIVSSESSREKAAVSGVQCSHQDNNEEKPEEDRVLGEIRV
ncbi:uncharacterized protein V6R79_002459 [Siganus canaliculatus]